MFSRFRQRLSFECLSLSKAGAKIQPFFKLPKFFFVFLSGIPRNLLFFHALRIENFFHISRKGAEKRWKNAEIIRFFGRNRALAALSQTRVLCICMVFNALRMFCVFGVSFYCCVTAVIWSCYECVTGKRFPPSCAIRDDIGTLCVGLWKMGAPSFRPERAASAPLTRYFLRNGGAFLPPIAEKIKKEENYTLYKIKQKEIPKEQQKKLRVAAYCRVSTDREEQESSLEIQMKSYRTIIEEHPDWELADIYAEPGLTGTTVKNRKEFLRMIEDAQAGKIDIILAKSISRFARNTEDMLKYTRMLRSIGVAVIFEKEKINTLSSTSVIPDTQKYDWNTL